MTERQRGTAGGRQRETDRQRQRERHTEIERDSPIASLTHP